jgi:hypothetical protein
MTVYGAFGRRFFLLSPTLLTNWPNPVPDTILTLQKRGFAMQSTSDIKDTAHRLIDALPDDTSWEKLLYTLQIRHDIEAGLNDSDAGYVVDSGDLRRELGITANESRMDAPINTPHSTNT